MAAVVARGAHVSAKTDECMPQLAVETAEKMAAGQARVVAWDDIKDDPPSQLKVSPIAMVPHKSRKWRAILDLSFRLRLQAGQHVPSVNETTERTAPRGSVDQLGHALRRIIHAFAEADPDDKVFAAKWDIKDGFWRLDCEDGEEWNFAFVLPQPEGEPAKLVIPTSLQMGWVESPGYFCAASETGRDVAQSYAEEDLGSLCDHKFIEMTQGSEAYAALPERVRENDLRYFLEVFVDDFIGIAVPTSREQLDHVANAAMTGIHEVFPPAEAAANDPIAKKKMEKGDGVWEPVKEILGFVFDGNPGHHTVAVPEVKQSSAGSS